MKRYWRELSSNDFGADPSRWIAVLPLSAIEQHGPHLPLGVDAIIAEGLIHRIAAALPQDSPALFLPVQQITKSDEHKSFPGTLTLGWDTAVRTCIDIGTGIARAGVRKLLIITSHGGNLAVMDIAGRELRRREAMLVACTSFERLGPPSVPKEGRIDIHGGPYETSLMLALRPDLVDMGKASDFPSAQADITSRTEHLGFHSSDATLSWLAEDLNAEGVTGDATSASAAEGEDIIARIVAGFCTLVSEIAETDPRDPLPDIGPR